MAAASGPPGPAPRAPGPSSDCSAGRAGPRESFQVQNPPAWPGIPVLLESGDCPPLPSNRSLPAGSLQPART
eukprot:5451345-Pyramimonas_sp.AAC.1